MLQSLPVEGGFRLYNDSPQFKGISFRIVKTEDCVPLTVYEWGERSSRTVIICQPLGVWAPLLNAFATKLAEKFHVLTWDSRGYPSINENFDEVDYSIDRHAEDLHQIALNFGLREFNIVGYCTGARIGIRYISKYPKFVGRSSFVCGRFVFFDQSAPSRVENSYFYKSAYSLIDAAACGANLANLYRRGFHDPAFLGVQDIDEFRDCMMKVFTNPVTMQRYSRLVISALESESDEILRNINSDVQLICVKDDNSVSNKDIALAENMLKKSRLEIFETGGHYALYKAEFAPDIARRIIAFFE